MRAALTVASGGARPGGGATVVLGSEEDRGGAHRVREDEVVLKVLSRKQGAHGDGGNRSPESSSATDGPPRGLCQRYRSHEGKQRATLAAQGQCGDACVKEKRRGGLVYRGDDVGEE